MKTRQNITALVYDKQGRMLSVGNNRYEHTHPIQAFYAQKAKLPEKIYLHAEIDALLRVRKGKPHRIVIVRKNKHGNQLPSEPCRICKLAMKDYGIKEIDYLSTEIEYING